MHIVVVAGGELPNGPSSFIESLGAIDSVVAVDGGLKHCLALGLRAAVLLGDLDSADPNDVDQARSDGITVIEYPTDKDATDLELALEYSADRGASAITVVAAFGGRLDHELATIGLLSSPRWASVALCARDARRSLHIVREQVALFEQPGTTISLVPWAGEVSGVTTSGMQWPLRSETLRLGTTRGVSNVAADAVQGVSIGSGVLLVISDKLEAIDRSIVSGCDDY